jgi:hypothetical protein
MDIIGERFPRAPSQTPRAAAACYAAAVLTAAVAVAYGLFGGTGRSVAIGLLVAVGGAILWCAVGTALALLAQLADRP